MLDGPGDFAFLAVTVAINEEIVFPRLPLARTGFDLGEIDAITPERRECVMQRADLQC